MGQPVVEIRSMYDTIEDLPYFTGSEAEARTWVKANPDAEVWFFITNGDGSTEVITLREFLEAQ